MSVQLIGITGKADSGKSTVAKHISGKYINCYEENFADPLKRACAEAFGIPPDNFYDTIAKEEDNDNWSVSPRKIAQFVGTEMFRQTVAKLIPETGSDFWARRLWLLSRGAIATQNGAYYDSGDTLVIGDVRFQNEYDMIINSGGIVIHLTRSSASDTVGIPGHESEAGVKYTDPRKSFHLYNNSTLEELYGAVDGILKASGFKLFTNVITPI